MPYQPSQVFALVQPSLILDYWMTITQYHGSLRANP